MKFRFAKMMIAVSALALILAQVSFAEGEHGAEHKDSKKKVKMEKHGKEGPKGAHAEKGGHEGGKKGGHDQGPGHGKGQGKGEDKGGAPQGGGNAPQGGGAPQGT